MSTYVISDIHGEYEMFLEMLNLIEFSDADVMYVLGDMVDRGPKSLEVVEHVMTSHNIKAIMGNHEEMLIDGITSFGMTGSMASRMFEGTNGYEVYKKLRKLWYKDRAKASEIIRYMRSLPLYKDIYVENQRYLLVHAGIKHSNVEENTKDDLLWIREEFIANEEPFISPIGDKAFTVIFGHTPTPMIDGGEPEIYWGANKIGIDCGATFTEGKMGCLRLEDYKEFYVTK